MVRLYLDSSAGETHIGEDDAVETYCGLQTGELRSVGAVNNPTAFAPDPTATHDECLAAFGRRYEVDDVLGGEDLAWRDMGDSTE